MNYKLIGQRNLRKYTEPKTSPTYAAAIEAQTIVDSLCGVPWGKVSAKDAVMSYHTEETVGEIDGQKINGLEMNVRIRDQFDAALFCADHAGGQHRAYANAAVYHYELPDGTLPKLTKLTAKVTSDPYNSAGARIVVLTNSTGVIPTNCNECRTGDAHADGVAPRTVAENGNWFPTMADCVFAAPEVIASSLASAALPSGGLQLQKHLFVFVLMESYSTVRGNWLEGSSFIRNLVEIETDAAVPGWTDGNTYDLSEPDGPWYCVYRHAVGNGEIERLFRVPQGANVVVNNADLDSDVPTFFCVEHDSIKSVFGPITIEGLQLVQKNFEGTDYKVVHGENCQFVDPDEIVFEKYHVVPITAEMIREVIKRAKFNHSFPNVKFAESGSLKNFTAHVEYLPIGGSKVIVELQALMDVRSCEIVKMCACALNDGEDGAEYYRQPPHSTFEPIDFAGNFISVHIGDHDVARIGQLYQNPQGCVARTHRSSADVAVDDVIEVGSQRDGIIESCNAQNPGNLTSSPPSRRYRVLAGSKVDFMVGDKLFNRICFVDRLEYSSSSTLSADTRSMSEIVHPFFGKNYDLLLDSYGGLNAYAISINIRDTSAASNNTMIIAGDFKSVNGVDATNGWAILRLVNRLDDNDELVTDYVNVIPMLLPRMKCVKIRSAEIENANLKSLVALGIVE